MLNIFFRIINPNYLVSLILINFYLLIFCINPLYSKTLRVGIYQNSPKVFIDTNGKPSGLFVDILNEIAKNEGWTLNYIPGTWSENLKRLESFEIDIVLDVAYTESRASNYRFNKVFVIDDWIEAFSLENKAIKSIKDLSGKRVAVLEGSVQDQLLTTEVRSSFGIDYTLNRYEDYPKAFNSLITDESDILLASRFFWFSIEKPSDIVTSHIILRPSHAFFAFPKYQSDDIIEIIDKNLIEFKNNPESIYYTSLKYWLNTKQEKNFVILIRWILSISLILFVVVISFIVVLRWQVKSRTKQLSTKNNEISEMNQRLNQLIGEYKTTQQELSKFQFMVENARQEVYLVHPNGDLAYVNNTVTSSLGYSKEELLQGGIKLFDSEFGNKYYDHFIQLKNNELPAFETIHFTKGGRKLIKRVKSFYISIDNKEYVCGFAEDITELKKAEKALRDSKQVFETLTSMSPVGIFRTRADGYTIYVNQKWCELSGLSGQKALGDGWISAVHPDDRNQILNDWKTRSNSGASSDAEYRFLRPDGSIVWVLGNAVPEKDGNEIIGYIGTITDISYLKKVEKEIIRKADEVNVQVQKYSQLLNLATDAFFQGDSNGNLIMVNNAASELTGFSQSELLSKNIRELFSDDEINKKPLRYDLLEQGIILKNERQLLRKNGERVFIEMNSAKMPDGTYQSFFRDITERKNAELLLKLKAEEIEAQNEEYRQLNHELTIAKAKAEESDRLKSAFLANMSHEIRTPMNAICGFSRLLERENLEPSKRKEFIDIINFNSENLLGIINDIVDISKIESGLVYISNSDFNLNKLLENIHQTLAQSVQAAKVNFTLKKSLPDSQCLVVGDSQKIKQIIVNLLVNAIKFTQSGYIDFGYNLISPKTLVFYVSDTGIGIPKEHTQTIFERFHQVEGAYQESRKGTGLGLAISKGFVELMGGEIWVESEIGKGSTFYFTLPFTRSNKTLTEKEPEININYYNWENRILLIVEDDEHNIHYLKEALNDTGANLVTVNSGEEAVTLYSGNNKFDIILMDIKLPGISGFEATQQIRLVDSRVPIIAQTAYAFSSDKDKALEAGCNAFITKPINYSELLHTIGKLLPKN